METSRHQKIYNIKKLISVEAKMTDIKKVAEQSLINTWFASQSYALTSTSNPQSSTIKKFERQGTGLYCKKRSFRKIVEAKKLASPSSYQSLQFNEWNWKGCCPFKLGEMRDEKISRNVSRRI